MEPAVQPDCVLLGAGGHAAVLVDALQAVGELPNLVALDTDAARWGTSIEGVPIVGSDEMLGELFAAGTTEFLLGVGSAGSTRVRQQIYAHACQLGLQPKQVLHPTSFVSSTVTCGDGLQALAAAVINTGAVLEENVLVNTGAIVEHHCHLESHVHVATGARLAGNVHVESGAHIGAGAVIIQGVRIGANAVVGAGAVVLRDVAAASTVVGVPAKAIERSAN